MAMRTGFVWAADMNYALRLFSEAELGRQLRVPPTLPSGPVLAALRFVGWQAGHQTPSWLKQLIEEQDDEWRRALLRWCTGSTAIPTTSGEGSRIVTVIWEPVDGAWPSASTCARQLTIPEYGPREGQEVGLGGKHELAKRLNAVMANMNFTEK